MNLSLSMDSKEVLFHLNYMGYKNVTREQLKNFMIDLKKLVKYENNIVKSEVKIQAGPANINIRRLFESQNTDLTSSRKVQDIQKQKEPQKCVKVIENVIRDEEKSKKSKLKPKCGNRSSDEMIQGNISASQAEPDRDSCHKEKLKCDNEKQKGGEKKQNIDKENIPMTDLAKKSKGFIRPRSSSQTIKMKPRKKTDAVSLYQNYKKDWTKFRSNICESSHSDLRWSIREKMMNNR